MTDLLTSRAARPATGDRPLGDGLTPPGRTSVRPTGSGTLRRLALSRFALAIAWAATVAATTPEADEALTLLLVVLYPLVDAAAVLVGMRAAGSAGRSRTIEQANVALSVVAAVGLGAASTVSIAAVLAVWGLWAIASGATQLLAGLGRRRLAGQWPLVVSGGLSMLAGTTFVAQGAQDATGLGSIAGYAVVGGTFFLVSALRLGRTAQG